MNATRAIWMWDMFTADPRDIPIAEGRLLRCLAECKAQRIAARRRMLRINSSYATAKTFRSRIVLTRP
jgi:hypothetical protein